jgi:cytidyltransferase-like protein
MKVGMIAGNFDVIHMGYIYMFNECSKNCDHFIVFLHDDPSIENKTNSYSQRKN